MMSRAALAAPVLFEGECLRATAGFPAIAYWRRGLPCHPVVVFLPAAGHLARVAYGHPGSNPRDFLDVWLAERGYGLLVLSYPSDHAAFDRLYPDMTVAQWGASSAGIACDLLRQEQAPPNVVLAGWSMAGRAVQAFHAAASVLGLNVECFISLAATPPIPKLAPVNPAGEPRTADGLWDIWSARDSTGKTRVETWSGELAQQCAAEGRQIIDGDAYRSLYLANFPIRLRGEPDQGHELPGLAATIADLGTLRFDQFPLIGAVVPTAPSDARHALTDQAAWHFFNAQTIFAGCTAPIAFDRLTVAQWTDLRALVGGLADRLTRWSKDGHFFFLGVRGACETTAYLQSLVDEARLIRQEMDKLPRVQVTGDVQPATNSAPEHRSEPQCR
jgi:hypothetical protein